MTSISVESAPLGDFAVFIRGITFKPNDVIPVSNPDAVVCMRTKNVQPDLDLSDVWAVPRSLVKRKDQFLKYGDILVSTANSWNLVGKCSWVPALPWKATLGGFISALRVSDPRLNERYLYYWFSAPQVQERVRKCARQTTNIANLSIDQCLALEIPLPTLNEQKRIAAILDQADKLQRLRQRAIDRLNELGQAIFYEMFGDPVTNPRGWPVLSIGELGKISTGNTPSRQIADYYGDGIEWVKPDNLVSSYVVSEAMEHLTSKGQEKGRIAPAGTTLVTCIAGSPGSIGNAAIADRDVAFNQQINAITPASGVDPYFLYGLVRCLKKEIQSASTGGMVGIVNKSKFELISAIKPPNDLQKRFGYRFLSLLKMLKCQELANQTIGTLLSSLQHRAFRGEL